MAKGFFDFLKNNEEDDFRKGREEGWRDRTMFGDSFHHDYGNNNSRKSESYRAGYEIGYDEGEE